MTHPKVLPTASCIERAAQTVRSFKRRVFRWVVVKRKPYQPIEPPVTATGSLSADRATQKPPQDSVLLIYEKADGSGTRCVDGRHRVYGSRRAVEEKGADESVYIWDARVFYNNLSETIMARSQPIHPIS